MAQVRNDFYVIDCVMECMFDNAVFGDKFHEARAGARPFGMS